MKETSWSIVLLTLLAPMANATRIDSCPTVGGMAKAVMQLRQGGVAISEPLARAQSDFDGVTQELVVKMITDAYEQPLMRVRENKLEAVTEFENMWTVACFNAESIEDLTG